LHSDCRVHDNSRPVKQEPLLETSIRDYVWLWDSYDNMSGKVPAVRERNRTQWGSPALNRTRAVLTSRCLQFTWRLPQLVPLFPVGNYTPSSTCAHRGLIQRGSVFCCMICHTSGQDDHPALQNNWPVELNSDVNWGATFRSSKCSKQTISLETRKQRRQRLFAGISIQ
jgi:hypothetical protein